MIRGIIIALLGYPAAVALVFASVFAVSYMPYFRGWPVPVSAARRAPAWLGKALRVFLWPLYRTYVDAVTVGRATLYLSQPTDDLIAHEYWHRRQAERCGSFRFAFMYAVGYLRHGYWNNRFEVEAREYAADSNHRLYDLASLESRRFLRGN